MGTPKRISVAFVLSFLSTHMAEAAHVSEQDYVFVAIDAAIESLKERPNQNMELSCTGVQVSNQGGTGISITANGGGIGSQTTGMSVSMSDAQCSATTKTATNALSAQAIKELLEIKAMLQKTPVDKPAVRSELSDLGKTYIVLALQAVIQALIMKRLGP